MQVSVEVSEGLERKMTVAVPAAEVDSAVKQKIQETAKRAKLDGFRAGKIPLSVVEKRFGAGIREEVLNEVIQRTYQEALQKEELMPAGYPQVEPIKMEKGEDFEYLATFEVYPEIDLAGFENIKLEKFQADITDADVDEMIEKLRKQRAESVESERAAVDGDKVEINYVGLKDGEEFAGGSAENYALELGSGSMIPGFEDTVVGMKAGDEKVAKLSFPEDYHAEDLKGAAVEFTITVTKVFDEVLPEVTAEFMEGFGVKTGENADFLAEVRKNMERELKQATSNKLKTQVLDGLIAQNSFDVPQALITNEIQRQKQAMVSRFGGGQSFDPSSLPDELFKEQADKSVRVGLILSEVVKKFEISADAERVRAMIEEAAQAYESPEEVINWYYGNQEQLQQVESAVLEEQIVEKVAETAQITETVTSYEEAVKPLPEGPEEA